MELENIKERWEKKYPYAISNWENNWQDVNAFFQFSGDIRRIMYTTNIIEGLNRQYRKVTKTKSVFPSDSSLEKMLYLATPTLFLRQLKYYQKNPMQTRFLKLISETGFGQSPTGIH